MNKKQAFFSITLAAFLASCSDDSNSWNASEVCPESGRGTFIDERDGQVYKYTTIGNQVWMAENLNYNADYSTCYDNDETNCEIFGRLYSLEMDGGNYGLLDNVMIDSICPQGWHIPSGNDVKLLISEMGGSDSKTAQMMKSTSLWDPSTGGAGSDECGFSAKPAGMRSGTVYESLYRTFHIWTSSMINTTLAQSLHIGMVVDTSFSFSQMSIRCIKD